MASRTVAVSVGCLIAISPAISLAQDDVAVKARVVLTTYCGNCHTRTNPKNGGFDYVLDREALLARQMVIPGKPGESELLQMVVMGKMPPKKARQPQKEDVAILEKWITAGAPAWEQPAVAMAESGVYRLIAADLESIPDRDRRFIRHFTLNHLAAGGWPQEEIVATRLALSKLLNSLSWHPRLAAPRPINEVQTVYRIDLRDYKWTERLWDRIAVQDPYTPDAVSKPPRVLRADWFIATASSASFYYELLQLPGADRALERLLQVDAPAGIEEGSARRAGFTDSGVSRNNRVIERHDAGFGAYWRSYDFSTSTDRQNLLDHPLGPPPANNSFVHAGGEMIFHLPNGLIAFLVTDGIGRRIERAPVEIVSDPGRAEKIVEAGISCFNCHAKGFIPKADMVRAHVLKNAQAFAKEDVEAVQALYRPDADLRQLLDRDNRRYHAALAELQIKPDNPDPINQVRNRYEGLVGLKTAAAEMGMAPAQFADRLRKSETLQRSLGALLAQGGTVQRSTFLNAIRELNELPVQFEVSAQAFSGHTDRVLCLAFAPDGRRAASGSGDRTVRIWDVATGKELQRLEGHSSPVLAIAFSADGRQLLSGSEDRTIRLWDLQSGKLLAVIKGHVDAVTALAFSADGRRAVSAGADRTLRVWNLRAGKEIASAPLVGPVRSVAFAPDGRSILAPAGDRTVRIWDAATGQELRRLVGHSSDVYAVAFSPDGGRIVTGGNDKTARVWDAVNGRELLVLKGHANAVVTVGFSADGKRIFSGSSQYQTTDRTLRVWDAADGKEIMALGGSDRDEVRGAAFAPDGQAALTIGLNLPIRLWKLTD